MHILCVLAPVSLKLKMSKVPSSSRSWVSIHLMTEGHNLLAAGSLTARGNRRNYYVVFYSICTVYKCGRGLETHGLGSPGFLRHLCWLRVANFGSRFMSIRFKWANQLFWCAVKYSTVLFTFSFFRMLDFFGNFSNVWGSLNVHLPHEITWNASFDATRYFY